MVFTLTDSLVQEIINALENQEKKFLVDAKNSSLIEKDISIKVDNDLYYEIPNWTSANGFSLREAFVSKVYSPIPREELNEVLHSGRGVFKNFKNKIKQYPEIEKKWHLYKNSSFLELINNWYNELRDLWGLEKLDQMSEVDDNLIYDDFSFFEINSDFDKSEIVSQINSIIKNDCQDFSEDVSMAYYEMWKKDFLSESTNQIGFVCRSNSDDFAGLVLANSVSENQKKVMVINSFFVSTGFRGLGIGTELLSLCLSKIKEAECKWVLIPYLITPEKIQPLLFRMGFEKLGSGYAAKLQ
jgi:predicted GNAT family N-acyltransferase